MNEKDKKLQARPNYAVEVSSLIKSTLSPKLMREKLLTYHESDIADALQYLKHDERFRLYSLLGLQILSEVIAHCDDRDKFIRELPLKKQEELLHYLDSALAIEYLKSLSKNDRALLIDLMDDERKTELSLINSFDQLPTQ